MVTKEEYWKETMDLLHDLFGDADAALRFNDTIPVICKIENGTIHRALLIEQNICRCCWHTKTFMECKHIIKRTVDRCNGAFAESGRTENRKTGGMI